MKQHSVSASESIDTRRPRAPVGVARRTGDPVAFHVAEAGRHFDPPDICGGVEQLFGAPPQSATKQSMQAMPHKGVV